MKPVIHARSETKSHEFAATVPLDKVFVIQQVHQAIGEALGLKNLIFPDSAEGSDDGVTRARNGAGIRINLPRALAEFAHKAIPKAYKLLSLSFFKPEIVCK
jgi:hypothetical protein